MAPASSSSSSTTTTRPLPSPHLYGAPALRLLTIAAVLAILLPQPSQSASTPYSSALTSLRSSLLTDYGNILIPPRTTDNQPIDVQMNINFQHLKVLDELTSVMSISFELRLWWDDPRLVYTPDPGPTPSDYLKFSTTEIWTPDVELGEQGARFNFQLSTAPLRVLPNTGRVIWTRLGLVDVLCKFDLDNFPFDRPSCPFTFRVWTEPARRMRLVPSDEYSLCPAPANNASVGVDLGTDCRAPLLDQTGRRYELVSISSHTSTFATPSFALTAQLTNASVATYRVEFSRYPQFYFNRIILPYSVIVVIAMFVLLIPWGLPPFVNEDELRTKTEPVELKTANAFSRMSFSITAILTAFTISWMVSRFVPTVENPTWLDRFSSMAIVLIIWPFLSTVLLSNIYQFQLNHGHSLSWHMEMLHHSMPKKPKIVIFIMSLYRFLVHRSSLQLNAFVLEWPAVSMVCDDKTVQQLVFNRVDRKNHQINMLRYIQFEEIVHWKLFAALATCGYLELFAELHAQTNLHGVALDYVRPVIIALSIFLGLMVLLIAKDLFIVRRQLFRTVSPDHIAEDWRIAEMKWDASMVWEILNWTQTDVEYWLAYILSWPFEDVHSQIETSLVSQPQVEISGRILFSLTKDDFAKMGFNLAVSKKLEKRIRLAVMTGGPIMTRHVLCQTHKITENNRQAWSRFLEWRQVPPPPGVEPVPADDAEAKAPFAMVDMVEGPPVDTAEEPLVGTETTLPSTPGPTTVTRIDDKWDKGSMKSERVGPEIAIENGQATPGAPPPSAEGQQVYSGTLPRHGHLDPSLRRTGSTWSNRSTASTVIGGDSITGSNERLASAGRGYGSGNTTKPIAAVIWQEVHRQQSLLLGQDERDGEESMGGGRGSGSEQAGVPPTPTIPARSMSGASRSDSSGGGGGELLRLPSSPEIAIHDHEAAPGENGEGHKPDKPTSDAVRRRGSGGRLEREVHNAAAIAESEEEGEEAPEAPHSHRPVRATHNPGGAGENTLV